jgi:hypothetical protein
MLAKHQAKDATVLVVDLITSDEDKKFAPAGRMATAIIEITVQKGGCLPQDLNEHGLPDTKIDGELFIMNAFQYIVWDLWS